MTRIDIALQRLANQQIAQPTCTHPAEVVRWLGAVQAQDYLNALWALGLRMGTASEQLVEQAFAAKTIIRTWPMRGTLHFVAPEDVRWMLDLLAPRVVQGSKSRLAQLELDTATIAASATVIARALAGGRQLTRGALYKQLEAAQISTAGQRGIHILGQLALQQLICLAAREGKQHTFALFDDWVPPAQPKARDEALALLAQRYFTSHGPASVQDFVWWAGLTVGDARVGVAGATAQLGRELIDGQEYYYAQDMPAAPQGTNNVFLLPPFDEFLVGYRDRSATLDKQYNQLIVPGGNGVFNPIVVIDGRVVGTWRRVFKRDTVVFTASPFTTWSNEQASAIAAAAERYSAFVERRAVIEI